MGTNRTRSYTTGGYDIIEKYAAEGEYASESEFARFLHETHPERSVNAWRNAIIRWRKRDPDNTITTGGIEAMAGNQMAKAYYDQAEDVYITCVGDNNMIKVAGDTHRAMKKAYSQDGENLNMRSLSREYDISLKFIQQYIKIHGWTHGMDIFTDEDIIKRDAEELIEELVESKRNEVVAKGEAKYWRELQKDAARMRHFDKTVLSELKTLVSSEHLPPKTPERLEMDEVSPYSVVISPTDLHFGSGAWIDETGTHYNLQEARNRLLGRTNNLISRLPGRPEKIFVATGSDWFHVDNEMGSTTKGTLQDLSASPTQIFLDGCSLAREHIEQLRGVSDIEVVFMRGNHDRHMALALMMYLSAVYEEIEDVTIVVNPSLRQYIKWGNNLLGFTHGDGVKGKDLPLLMASEESKLWGDCDNRVWFHGHLHHQQVIEKGGTTVIQLPSLSGTDRYHYSKGYTMNKAGICAHLLDKEMGLIGNLFAPVIE